MKRTALHVLALIAVAAAIFFTNLGQARLWDRDEPRNAGCAQEMMERGDLIVPIFNDELRHQKPVLLYWLMISAYSVMGVSEFAARFWSAFLGLGTALLTYGIARRFFNANIALLSGIAVSCSLMFAVAARAATPDSALIFFSTLGLFIYVVSTFKRGRSGCEPKTPGHWFPQNYGAVVLMNVAFALGVLTKGPVGLVLPTAIIGMFLLIQRLPPLSEEFTKRQGRWSLWLLSILRPFHPMHFVKTCWRMRPFTAIAVVLLIAAPWYIAVGWKTHGDFSRLFFLNENFARATSVMENHKGAWWYYLAAVAVGFFPWSIFFGPVALTADRQLSRKSNDSALITFLLCWVGVQIGLFSLAETKLPSYVTPCYPALAILTAACLLKWLPLQTAAKPWLYGAYGTFIFAGLLMLIGLWVAAPYFFPDVWWIALIGLIPLVGGTLSILALQRNRYQRSVQAMVISAAAFCLLFFGFGTVVIDSTRQTGEVLDEIRTAAVDQPVATYKCLESSWVVYAERPIFELFTGPLSEQPADSLTRSAPWKRKPVISPESFVAIHPNAMFMTTDQHLDELLNRLPDDFQVHRRAKFFLKPERELVLIKKADTASTIARSGNNAVR